MFLLGFVVTVAMCNCRWCSRHYRRVLVVSAVGDVYGVGSPPFLCLAQPCSDRLSCPLCYVPRCNLLGYVTFVAALVVVALVARSS